MATTFLVAAKCRDEKIVAGSAESKLSSFEGPVWMSSEHCRVPNFEASFAHS